MQVNLVMPVVLLFLAAILLITLVVIVMFARRREYLHYFFALFMTASAVWAIGIGLFLSTKNPQFAFIMASVYYITAAVIGYALILLVLSIPVRRANLPDIRVIKSSWILLMLPALTMILCVVLPNGLIKEIGTPSTAQNIVILQPFAYAIYASLFLLYAIASTTSLFYRLRRTKERRYRQQFGYIAGSVLFGVSFGSFFNLILPLFGNYDLIWIGPLCGIPIVMTIFYSIVRHSLFDIRHAVVRTATYILSLATLAVAYYLLAVTLATFFVHTSAGVEQNIMSAVIAIVLAFIFQPIKRFFDRLTSNIFYKGNYNPTVFFAHLTRTLATNTDLRSLLERAAREVNQTLKAKQTFFFVHDSNTYVSAGTPHHSRLPLEDTQALDIYVREVGGGIIITDLLESSNSIHRLLVSHKILLALPLLRNKSIVGYLCLGEHQSGSYTSRDINVLETIADELVIAIENALSVQEVRELNETLQQRINEATKDLRESNKQLRRLDAAKDEFVSMASHQLRTPLTSVKGYVSMMLEGDAGQINEMQKHFLEEAFISSERMVHLINDFLNVSRLQTGKFIIERRKTDLKHVVTQEVDSLRTTAGQRQLTLKLKLHGALPPLYLDESKIRQVIMNFIDNALYYSAPGTTILISLGKEAGEAVLTVKDMGIGVPSDEQAHLFTKFYRASNARKQRPDGTGVGLFLAKKVIVAHGGSMIFASEEGKGSTFGFSLPIQKLERAPAENADNLDN